MKRQQGHPSGPGKIRQQTARVSGDEVGAFRAQHLDLSVRDPMAKRVKALNDRREQLKAGITASTSKRRAKLVQKNETTDRIRSLLSGMKVLQDEQVKAAQIKLVETGGADPVGRIRLAAGGSQRRQAIQGIA